MHTSVLMRVAIAPGRWVVRSLSAERDRWFFWAPVAFGVGIAIYFSLPHEPSVAPLWGGLLAALVAWGGIRWFFPAAPMASLVASTLLLATSGALLAKLRTEHVRAPVLVRPLGPVDVRGFVELVEPRPTRGQRLTIRVTGIDQLAKEAWPYRIRVRTPTAVAGLAPGRAIRMKAKLIPPQRPLLPGGYDFARSAWFQSLGAVGFTFGRPTLDPTAAPPPFDLRLASRIARVRQTIGARIAATLDGQTGAVAVALITGERGGISAETNAVYKNSGLYHVLSISGLHMVIMAGTVFFATRLGLAFSPMLALRFPIKKWAAVAGLLGTLGYLLISGGAFATVRSALMIAILFLAMLLDRPAITLRNVALAAGIILAIWPESLLDAGFQMSFAAVTALVASYEGLRDTWAGALRSPHNLFLRVASFPAGIVLSTLVASVAVAPFAAFHFQQTQAFALVANVLAIPICNLIVMPAGLLTLLAMPLGLDSLPLWVMARGIDMMTGSAEWVAGLPGATGHIAAIPQTAFVLIVSGGLWMLLWRTRWRLLGAGLVMIGGGLSVSNVSPDILIGDEGRLIAMRDATGRLTALPAPDSTFELSRWLQWDGDNRSTVEVSLGRGFVCDALGCIGMIAGFAVALPGHPAALPDDCARADILVLRMPAPRACSRPRVIIDIFALKIGGTHALYIATDKSLRVDTVHAARGDRPWSQPPPWATRRPRTPCLTSGPTSGLTSGTVRSCG